MRHKQRLSLKRGQTRQGRLPLQLYSAPSRFSPPHSLPPLAHTPSQALPTTAGAPSQLILSVSAEAPQLAVAGPGVSVLEGEEALGWMALLARLAQLLWLGPQRQQVEPGTLGFTLPLRGPSSPECQVQTQPRPRGTYQCMAEMPWATAVGASCWRS